MNVLKFISVFLLLFIFACSNDSSTSPEDLVFIDGQTYTNQIFGFKISAPDAWQLEMNKDVTGMHALLFGIKSNFDGINPTFSLISSDANGMETPGDLLAASESYIVNQFPGVVFEFSETFTVDGFNCALLEYSFIYNGADLKQKQLLFFCRKKAVIAVTFTSEKFDYEFVEEDFNSIINSLKML